MPRANCLEAAMPERKNKLVAIVEDNQPFRESMQKLITLLGYPVEAFPSAASFLASPFVVEVACLVAVNMPGMTGLNSTGTWRMRGTSPDNSGDGLPG